MPVLAPIKHVTRPSIVFYALRTNAQWKHYVARTHARIFKFIPVCGCMLCRQGMRAVVAANPARIEKTQLIN